MDRLISTFPIVTGATDDTGHYVGAEAKLYQVQPEKIGLLKGHKVGEIYIVDSPAGREIASHPSLVGNELWGKSLKAASAFTCALNSLDLNDENAAILHILRGAVGYMIHEALPEVPVLSVRTEYGLDGYRDHPDDSRNLTVTYRDYGGIPKTSTLIIPDTFATGRSAEVALKDLMKSGVTPERVILYGFVAVPSILRLSSICRENDIDLFTFAISDLTPLAYNNYDMPLYGLDESLYSATGKVKLLGAVVDAETLEHLSLFYIAGMDQPGDWSERHSSLYNGRGNKEGDMLGHLRKSLDLIEKLQDLNSLQGWYNKNHREIALREIQLLRNKIVEYQRTTTL